jgi:hypothetical protein
MMRFYILALAGLASAIGLIGVASADGGGAPQPRTCFPRAAWDADTGDRPCARIVRVYEDASVCVRVGPADGSVTRRACVGNPFDRGRS